MALFSREGKFGGIRFGGCNISVIVMTLTMLAAGGVMSVFYFPAAVPLGILNANGRKREFFLLLALGAGVVAMTATPAGFLIFAAAVSGGVASGALKSPSAYFRKLFTGFFAAAFALLAGGWIFSLTSAHEIFRAMSKIFLFSLAGNTKIIEGPQAAMLAEKAFRIVSESYVHRFYDWQKNSV